MYNYAEYTQLTPASLDALVERCVSESRVPF